MKNKKIALVIGSAEYDNLPPLFGAKNDADEIFSLLTSEKYGEYNKEKSIKLISPTMKEYQEAIDTILFKEKEIDVFTFYFAGHGGNKDGSYYLALKDTNWNKMSMTAISLSHMFQNINESKPKEINIIIDACESAGFLNELDALIKFEILKKNTTFKYNILVSCGIEQYAGEINDHGLFTLELIKCLSGKEKINTEYEHLDLGMLHKKILDSDIKNFNDQNTFIANFTFGKSQFTKNPFYNKESHISKLFFSYDEYNLIEDKVIKNWEEIFEEYQQIKNNPKAIRLSFLLDKITENDIKQIPILINGLESKLIDRASESDDYFADITIISTLMTKLLSFTEHNDYKKLIENLNYKRKSLLEKKIKILLDEMKNNPNCLTSNINNPLSEFFYIPIRISKILGTIWGQILINKKLNQENFDYNECVKEYTNLVYKNYQKSLICISEEQASSIYIMDLAAKSINEDNVIINILNAYFESIIQDKGHIAKFNLSTKKVPLFLMCKEDIYLQEKFTSNPSELISVFLLLKNTLVKKELWDKELINLDYKNLTVVIPQNYEDFNIPHNFKGVAEIYTIGKHIWTIEDYKNIFENELVSKINAAINLKNSTFESILIISSLIFPNRIPWLLSI